MAPSRIATPPAPSPSSDLHLPRILCLHGGGTNADIFRLQCRAIIARLQGSFRLVFADAPHFCGPGPDVELVYKDHGPFRRWLRWKPLEHPEVDDESAAGEILYCVRRAMDEDAGRGEWVGLLGFSQGAKVAASLLYETQRAIAESGRDEFGWRFAVVMQGRHPLVSLSERTRHPALVTAGGISEGFNYDGVFEDKLRLPTVHVHGLTDVGRPLHQRMLQQYCSPDSAVLVEWNGGHRLPIKPDDVGRICEAIMRLQ